MIPWIGTIIAVGGPFATTLTTFIVHAIVTPMTFAALSWHYQSWYPHSLRPSGL